MPLSDNNIEMNQETFWVLLREAKDKCGQNLRAEADWITEQLLFMGSEQALAFHEIMDAYKELANRYGLWNAADLMMDWCSDDGFIDFRAWLIAQGKEVYLAALKEPDSLAEVTPYGGCTFESLSYVGYHAYEKLTGQSAYDDAFHGYDPQMVDALKAELGKEIVYMLQSLTNCRPVITTRSSSTVHRLTGERWSLCLRSGLRERMTAWMWSRWTVTG